VIREVHAGTGIITTVVGNGTAGYSGDGGAATSAELNAPEAIAFDASGDRTGSVIQLDGEQMLVMDVNASAGTLTVDRGFNGTGATTHFRDLPHDVVALRPDIALESPLWTSHGHSQ
jgi:hypothetical protein